MTITAGADGLRAAYGNVSKIPAMFVFDEAGREIARFRRQDGPLPDAVTLRQTLDQYRMQGCSVAIDDAGTGYSNLEAIMKLEPTYLKIDMSLVRGIDASVVKQELIKALSGMARSITAQVIAEGIETPAEYQTLLDLGVEFGQGYLFARPGVAFPEIQLLPT